MLEHRTEILEIDGAVAVLVGLSEGSLGDPLNSGIIDVGANHHFEYSYQIFHIDEIVIVDIVNFEHELQLLPSAVRWLIWIN